ncbi:MAG TPA: 3-oxoacyl-[acyl-carrier-protein] synthase III C-terminal domain-containing protein, partial [Ignavibacteria bacterium]
VRDYVKCNIEEITTKNNISISDIKFFVTHPGGMKVIKAYEKSLGLTNGTLKYSRKVLSSHGNMSAPSVLYVLKEFFKSNEFKQKGYGLLSSLGPGFSSELVLFKSL